MPPGKRRRWWLLLLLLPIVIFAIVIALLLVPRPPRPVVAALRPGPHGELNVLVVGRDARAVRPASDDGHNRRDREKRSHSDVVMIVHFNIAAGRVNLLSLPRDLLVEVPGVTVAESLHDFRRMEKLAHVHAIGGVPLLRRTVEDVLGVTIHRAMAFDFDSFRMTFGLLRPFLGSLDVSGDSLGDREDALMFARRRYGLREHDLDRNRNNLLLVRAVIEQGWWLSGNRLGTILVRRVLGTLADDTDITPDDLEQVFSALREAGFEPSRVETAVLVGEGQLVHLERYNETWWCYLPAYEEIGRQVDRYLCDREDVPALDFMARQDYHAPAYLFADYSTMPDSLPPADTTGLSTRLKELEMLGRAQDSLP